MGPPKRFKKDNSKYSMFLFLLYKMYMKFFIFFHFLQKICSVYVLHSLLRITQNCNYIFIRSTFYMLHVRKIAIFF